MHTRHRTRVATWRHGLVALVSALSTATLPAAAEAPWTVVGRQGLVRIVIVPVAAEKDRSAYEHQIARLCDPEQTCFLNFHTNRSGAPATLPLPDAIAHEATATYRRSMKNGVQRFQWSCRLQMGSDPCF